MQRNQHYKFFIFQIFLIIFLFPSLSLATALKSIDAQPQAIGGLHNGALKNGFNAHQFLKNNPQVILVSPEEFQFSTREIAELVVQFASWVYRQWQYPLLVGDMSLREGGKIAEHKAHRNGLDIDIGYIPLKPTHIDQHLHRQHLHRSDKYNNRFPEKFEIAGKLSENFDKLKNFASFRYLVNSFPVKAILVSCAVKKELLATTLLFPEERKKILLLTSVKSGHEDHFHVRIQCPAKQLKCIDEANYEDIGCSLK
jgi:murein endopeptidase